MENTYFDIDLFEKNCKQSLAIINLNYDSKFKKNIHYESISNFYLSLKKMNLESNELMKYRVLLADYLDLITKEKEKILEENSQENYSKYVEPIGVYLAEKDDFALRGYIIFIFIGISMGLFLTVLFRNYIWVLYGTFIVILLRIVYLNKKRKQNKLYGYQF
ncbi:hypothetical protein GWK08_06645 [Leptobacterium flavescens]|uniref:Uncharacterized protein n=1 Tax=Leptobacterium flavescens TaxID=472055 RepID=A0A6P0UL14_9FLAO|nr:hypothetical protein [Leptobacterium flavescens]NER13110.1 hypothetical protein [Leptobacterium flavescens]